MVGKFWDMLFDYADKAKASGDMERYKIVHEIEDLLQTAYDLGVSSSSNIVNYKGRGDMERLILSIPDIIVYKDPMDDTMWYELDYEVGVLGNRRRFDTPQEVIKYLIQYRTNKMNRSMGAERTAVIEFMMGRLKDFTIPEVYGNPKTIREVETDE